MKTSQILTLVAGAALWPLAPPAAGQATFRTLYTFTDDSPTGLALGNGVLYGITEGPTASFPCGTVFELQPPAIPGGNWTETVLYAFAATNDACQPAFAPIMGPGGTLYGLTYAGGLYKWR